jgi:Tfp pilus assembly protein PilF
VRRLVADFDQSASGRLARLAALTTNSLAALKTYLQGEQEFRLGRHLPALDLFRRATIEDDSFALAYYRMASSLAAHALIGPARYASTEAHRHRGRLSEHDRLLLEAQHAWLHGQTAEAERRYAALTVAFPEQVEPWYLLGDLLFHSNPYRGRSIAEAREPFERTLAIDDAHVGALTQLARLAAFEGTPAQLSHYVERCLRSSPSADQGLSLRVLLAFAAGSDSDQQRVTDELIRAPGLVIARAVTDVALYAGDLAGAERLGHAILPAARSAEFAALGNIVLAHLELALGKADQAVDRLRQAADHDPAWSIEVRGLVAALPFAAVSPEERDRVTEELDRWDPSVVRPAVAVPLVFHDGLHHHLRQYLLGLLAARRRELPAVRLAADSLSELPVPAGAEVLAEQLARTLDAEALRLEGRPDQALAALERIKTDVWFQYAVGSPFYAGTYQRFLRADLLAGVGRQDEAVRWWETMAQRSPYELVFAAEARRRITATRTGQSSTHPGET